MLMEKKFIVVTSMRIRSNVRPQSWFEPILVNNDLEAVFLFFSFFVLQTKSVLNLSFSFSWFIIHLWKGLSWQGCYKTNTQKIFSEMYFTSLGNTEEQWLALTPHSKKLVLPPGNPQCWINRYSFWLCGFCAGSLASFNGALRFVCMCECLKAFARTCKLWARNEQVLKRMNGWIRIPYVKKLFLDYLEFS